MRVDFEQRRGTPAAFNAALGSGQGRFNVPPHGLLERPIVALGRRLGGYRGPRSRRRAVVVHGAQRLGDLQAFAVAEDGGPVDHRAQFADVARPVVRLQQPQILRRRVAGCEGEPRGRPLGKMLSQVRNVFMGARREWSP